MPYNPKNGIKQICKTQWNLVQNTAITCNRYKNIAHQQEINEEWENIKSEIIESAKETNYKKSLQRMSGGMKSVNNPVNKRM